MNEHDFCVWCGHFGGSKTISVPWSKEKVQSTTFKFQSDRHASTVKARLKEIASCPNVERIGEYLQFHIQ